MSSHTTSVARLPMKLNDRPDGEKTPTEPPPARFIQPSPIVLSGVMWKPPVRQLCAIIQVRVCALVRPSVSPGSSLSSKKASFDQTQKLP